MSQRGLNVINIFLAIVMVAVQIIGRRYITADDLIDEDNVAAHLVYTIFMVSGPGVIITVIIKTVIVIKVLSSTNVISHNSINL